VKRWRYILANVEVVVGVDGLRRKREFGEAMIRTIIVIVLEIFFTELS
jgi:hypothetical protein